MILSKHRGYGFEKEIIFQIILNIILFFSYAIHPPSFNIAPHEIFYYLNYALGAVVINYLLLPRFFYKQKYWQFFTCIAFLILIQMLIEEEVLEKIYFPDLKGVYFGNVIFTLLDILPVIMILTGFKFAWDAAKKQQEVNTLKTLIKESELQFLKTQINPHFLFNNLNNLYSYAIENSKKTPSIILELASVLRYMLYDCRADYVPLTKEIEHVENFTKLNELQIENRGVVQMNVGTVSEGYQIAPLILNVFIENAFKHSTASQSNEIFIQVNLEMIEDTLHFTCKNSYGLHSNQDDLPKGIGLKNVQKRLHFLYDHKHTLCIKKEDHFYLVDLTLQLTKKAEK